MKRARVKAWCAAVLGVVAISCRFRYEQLEVPLSSDGGGEGASGGRPAGGTAGGSGGAAAAADGGMDNAGVGAATVGGTNEPTSGSGGTAAAGISGDGGDANVGGASGGNTSGGGISGSATNGGTNGGSGGGQNLCVPDAKCGCDAFQGHEYRFCAVQTILATGEAACKASNMVLARVDSAEENAWLLQQFIDRGMFIGSGSAIVILDGSDAQVEGMWRWNDGTLFWAGGPIGTFYTNWGSPPKAGQGDCVGMLSTGKWAGRACNDGNATVACESP